MLNAGYKIYAKIVNNRLNTIAHSLLLEEQCGFRKGRSCTDNIFSLKKILEKRREFNLKTYIAFIDYVKAFDMIDREQLWSIMQKNGYPKHLIQIIQGMYIRTKIVLDLGHKLT